MFIVFMIMPIYTQIRHLRKDGYMIKAGIIGSTGYAGGELVRILTGHKDVEIKWFGSKKAISIRNMQM